MSVLPKPHIAFRGSSKSRPSTRVASSRFSPVQQHVRNQHTPILTAQSTPSHLVHSGTPTPLQFPPPKLAQYSIPRSTPNFASNSPISPQRGRPTERTPFGSSRKPHPPVSGKGRQLVGRIHEGYPLPSRYRYTSGTQQMDVGTLKITKSRSPTRPFHVNAAYMPESSAQALEAIYVGDSSPPSITKTVEHPASAASKRLQLDEGISIVAKMKSFWEANTRESAIHTELAPERRTENVSTGITADFRTPSSAAKRSATSKMRRIESNVSPKTIPKQSIKVAGATKTDPLHLFKTIENASYHRNRDQDGATDSMVSLLNPHANGNSLTTVHPLFFKTPQTQGNATKKTTPASTNLDGEGTSDMPRSTDI